MMTDIKDKSAQDIERTNHEAREWFIKIHYGGKDDSTTQAFEGWLGAHQDHRRVYEEVCALMQATEKYTNSPEHMEKYSGLLADKADNVVAFRKTPVFRRKFLAGSIAASLLLLLGFSFTFQLFFTDDTYQTAIGEQKTVVLADGSTIKLNTNTKIEVAFSDEARSVTLDFGQAYFIIAKDAARPFTVNFGKGTVTALGTEFEVYNKGPEVVVTLVEGTVKVQGAIQKSRPQTTHKAEEIIMVASEDTAAGTQISLSAESISPVTTADKELINAWQDNQLIFREKSLKYVIAEINRYSTRKIILGQTDLETELVSGVFPIESEEALDVIKKFFDMKETVSQNGERILVRAG